MEPVTVILADDHPVFRDGLQRLLEGAGIVVLAAVGGRPRGARRDPRAPAAAWRSSTSSCPTSTARP